MSVRSQPAAGFLPPSATPKWAAGSFEFPSSHPDADLPASNPFGFALFLVLNAVLFIRPSEIFPDLAAYQIYYYVIIPCMLVSLPTLLFKVLMPQNLAQNPIAVCVLGLLPLAVISMIGRITLADMQEPLTEYLKVIIYFLLLISCVNTPGRIRLFLTWIVVCVTILTAIALLQWHEVINIPEYEMCVDRIPDPDDPEIFIWFYRLQYTGIFNDPNDLCLVMGLGTALCLCKLGDRDWGLFRVLWLLPIPLFGYALYLTQSRGGLLGVLVGILVLLTARFGWKKGLPLALLCSPVLYLLSGTRQGDFDIGKGTAQDRVQLWSEGFTLFQRSPLRGIGFQQYAEEVGLVAHNSYVHTFTELGVFGGTLFVGAFFLAVWTIYRLRRIKHLIPDAEMRRIQPYLLGGIAAYAGSMYSLSRPYVVPTYMILGIAAVYVRTAVPSGVGLVKWDFGLVKRLLLVGFLTLAGLYLFTRIFVSYG